MLKFAGLWCPNYLTHGYSWGIIGKIISVAFIWYLVVICVTASLVKIGGLILSSLKMLISVQSNEAVLGTAHHHHIQTSTQNIVWLLTIIQASHKPGQSKKGFLMRN